MSRPSRPYGVTDRELSVLQRAAEGLTRAATARNLGLSPETVKTALTSLRNRMGATTTAQAVALGYESGLLHRPGGGAR